MIGRLIPPTLPSVCQMRALTPSCTPARELRTPTTRRSSGVTQAPSGARPPRRSGVRPRGSDASGYWVLTAAGAPAYRAVGDGAPPAASSQRGRETFTAVPAWVPAAAGRLPALFAL